MIGCHLSLQQFLATTNTIDAVQVFFGSPQRFNRKSKSSDELKVIADHILKTKIHLNIHGSYMINLSKNDSIPDCFYQDCKEASELASLCNTDFIDVVIHMGKSLKLDINTAYENYCNNLSNFIKEIAPTSPKFRILLETSANQGTEIGFLIKDLHKLFISTLDKLPKELHKHLGICLDTCHIFASGEYDLSNPEQTVLYLDNVISLFGKNVHLIHLNDSMKECCCHVDRHAKLGEGFIFKEKTKELLSIWMNFSKKHNIPMVLETPDPENLGVSAYLNEIEMVRNSITEKKTIVMEKQTKSSKKEPNNDRILDMIGQMILIEKSNKQPFKVRAYSGALKSIKELDFEITSIEQLKDIDGIGKSIMEKIKQVLENEKITKIEEADTNLLKAVAALTKVAYIGEARAIQLYKEYKITSITALKKLVKENPDVLTTNQQMCLKYHTDLQKRIMRKDLEEFEKYLNNLIKPLKPIILAGSYRRNAVDSGDCDVLINTQDIENFNQDKLIKLLGKKVKHILSNGNAKTMFLYELNKQVIHLDFEYVTNPDSYPFTLLYFTGSYQHNIVMRNRAIELDMKLNEYGITDSKGKQILCKDEKSIFLLLGMEYKEPKDR